MAHGKLGQPQTRRLGDLLVAEGLLTEAQLRQALAEQKGKTEKLGSILARLGFITEEQLIGFLSRQYGIPSITLSNIDVDAETLRLVPAPIARKYEVLPIKRIGGTLTLAMADPTNVFALDDVAFMTSLQILPVVAPQAAVRKAIEKHYEAGQSSMTEMMTEITADANIEVLEGEAEGKGVDVFELKESADEAPVVKLVNMVLVDAIRKGASDLHWEPYEKHFRIRFRVDGVLHEMLSPPKRLEPAIISRLKIMSNLDISERRVPQDGRIKLRFGHREIDFRVSILPTIFGQKAVLRILDKEPLQLDLTKRDLETAQISIRAALTGHLVFTTLHTNDCPSTVARLFDMGIQPFLLSSALLLILAQWLGRRICKECKQPMEGKEEDLVPYGHVPQGRENVTFHRGKGCATCNFTGMKGRVAIYEVMPVTEPLRDMILKNAATADIREQAQKDGMKTLRQSGLMKVIEGTTTVEEVLRVTLS